MPAMPGDQSLPLHTPSLIPARCSSRSLLPVLNWLLGPTWGKKETWQPRQIISLSSIDWWIGDKRDKGMISRYLAKNGVASISTNPLYREICPRLFLNSLMLRLIFLPWIPRIIKETPESMLSWGWVRDTLGDHYALAVKPFSSIHFRCVLSGHNSACSPLVSLNFSALNFLWEYGLIINHLIDVKAQKIHSIHPPKPRKRSK